MFSVHEEYRRNKLRIPLKQLKKKPVDVYMENISNVNALALNHLSTSEIYNSEMVRWSGANYAAAYLLRVL